MNNKCFNKGILPGREGNTGNTLISSGRWLFLILVLAGLFACTSRQAEEGDGAVGIQLTVDSRTGQLSVSRSGDTLDWKGDTLAVITWWNADSTEFSQAVSKSTGWDIKRKSMEGGYRLTCLNSELGFSFPLEMTKNEDVLTVSIPSSEVRESGSARLKKFRLLPRFGAATEGEQGYLVTSKGVGTICYFKDRNPAEYRIPVYGTISNCLMPLFGLVRAASGMAAIVISGQYDLGFCISTQWGPQRQYGIDPEFILRSFMKENRLSDNLTVEYHFLSAEEAGWEGIGKRYRQYNFDHRGLRPLRQRAAESPELAYSAGAMEVRLRLGVKPVPYHIVEQTAENEPPMRLFLTFSQVREIIDEFKRQGIDQAELCLVGWNIGGHDGRYPQILPVENLLGGESELRKTIQHAQSLGYQIVGHDNLYDAYRISEDWSDEYIRKKADGTLFTGGQWGGGQSYNICLSRAFDLFAHRNFSAMRELGFKGLHYSDVLSILGPRPCYDPRHHQTRREDAQATNKILDLAAKTFGGIQSEGSLDFTAPALDRLMYIQGTEESFLKLPYVDACIPLFGNVYHGVLLYNLSHETVNTEQGETFYLRNIEYGSLPLDYFYGHFYLHTRKNWLGNRDYRYDNKKGLGEAVGAIKKVYDDLQKLKHLQYEFLEKNRKVAEGVMETVYSNGQSVVVNYNEVPFALPSGNTVPARGFLVLSVPVVQ